jgi:hypothetical protein
MTMDSFDTAITVPVTFPFVRLVSLLTDNSLYGHVLQAAYTVRQ